MSTNPSFTSVLTTWRFEPQIVLALVLTGVLYVLGLRELDRRGKLWRLVGRRHVALFALGLLSLALALLSPLDTYDTRLFSVHMLQHLVLLQVAPPLLLLGKPVPVLLVGLPRPLVRGVARAQRRTPWLRWLTHKLISPPVAWTLYAADLLLWHVPALYQATLYNTGVHLLEHVCFVGTGLLFWWVIVEPLPRPRSQRLHLGLRLLYTVSAMLPMNLLGALLTLADRLWYPFYGAQPALWGWSAIDDQRLGGLLMWLAGSMIFMGIGSVMFFRMLAQDERDRERDEAEDGAYGDPTVPAGAALPSGTVRG